MNPIAVSRDSSADSARPRRGTRVTRQVEEVIVHHVYQRNPGLRAPSGRTRAPRWRGRGARRPRDPGRATFARRVTAEEDRHRDRDPPRPGGPWPAAWPPGGEEDQDAPAPVAARLALEVASRKPRTRQDAEDQEEIGLHQRAKRRARDWWPPPGRRSIHPARRAACRAASTRLSPGPAAPSPTAPPPLRAPTPGRRPPSASRAAAACRSIHSVDVGRDPVAWRSISTRSPRGSPRVDRRRSAAETGEKERGGDEGHAQHDLWREAHCELALPLSPGPRRSAVSSSSTARSPGPVLARR